MNDKVGGKFPGLLVSRSCELWCRVQYLVGSLRDQYWDQCCLKSSLVTWMMGLNTLGKFADDTKWWGGVLVLKILDVKGTWKG